MSRSSQRRSKRLHWWNRGSGIRLRVWMAVNVLLLATISYGVYAAVQTKAEGTSFAGLGVAPTAPGLLQRLSGGGSKPADTVPDKSLFLAPKGVYFGAATPGAPYSSGEVSDVAAAAGGVRPTMTEFFVNWTQSFRAAMVTSAYDHGTLPVISWEPWAGGQENNIGVGQVPKNNADQPKYRLANIIDGSFDSYITAFAKGVAAAKWPVALRFAHEMNGTWYPWSEKTDGNKPGQYVAAWRHVHDLFQQAGATNVIWVWSPNIIRPVPHTKLSSLYPGDAYVDWVGLTGYGVRESTPATTFDPTLRQVRALTKKPILITETGAQPDKDKVSWVTSFFPWLEQNHDIIGFVWTEKTRTSGALSDWRFNGDPQSEDAFQNGISTASLVTGLGSLTRPSSGSTR
ncbi:glycoside hydrolase family 26 protein [Streptacidiphilus anmyonensis]|uniref:glycoside hydrolase family 26 protein n=1 Tax=Streptacidiphilus anmyonensis TaxID=405782 RepID=UPI000B336590|nr:glycosyl hydrolase [Streptacidiphilus anmyonensis]